MNDHHVPPPALLGQARVRTTARIIAVVLVVLGLGAIGRTAQPSSSTVTGPYCRQCGTRNDAEARFCDSCGQSMG